MPIQGFEIFDKVLEISHLKELEKDYVAVEILNRLVELTAPLLKRRKWKVKKLMEFFPEQESLFGTNENKGDVISIRLRHPKDISVFLEWSMILKTMCHELAQSNHELEFFQLMSKIEMEVQTDEKKYTNSYKGYRKYSSLDIKNRIQQTGNILGGNLCILNTSEIKLLRVKRYEKKKQCVQCGSPDMPVNSTGWKPYWFNNYVQLQFVPIICFFTFAIITNNRH